MATGEYDSPDHPGYPCSLHPTVSSAELQLVSQDDCHERRLLDQLVPTDDPPGAMGEENELARTL